MKDLSDFRISYDKLSLIEQHLPNEPFKLFQTWFEELCKSNTCLLYTSPSPRDRTRSRMPSSA